MFGTLVAFVASLTFLSLLPQQPPLYRAVSRPTVPAQAGCARPRLPTRHSPSGRWKTIS